jgi:hypothetical protein
MGGRSDGEIGGYEMVSSACRWRCMRLTNVPAIRRFLDAGDYGSRYGAANGGEAADGVCPTLS